MPDGDVAETMPEVEETFEEIEVDAPLVGIIMGSKNDKPKLQPAGEALRQPPASATRCGVLSAHRDPEATSEYCSNARMRGLKVIIAGAGMSAALPGFAASKTDLPVIGVPISGKNLGGRAALRGPDAPGRAGRLRRDRRRQERRSARRPDPQRVAPGPTRQNQGVIPRYTREVDGRRLGAAEAHGDLAPGRARGHRRLGG